MPGCPSLWVPSLVLAAAASGQPQRVEIELRRDAAPAVAVSVTFVGESDGDSTVSLAPEWGGFVGLGREIGELRCWDDDGTPLKTRRESDHAWTVAHEPEAIVTVRYQLVPHARQPVPPGRNDYRNRVDASVFHAIAQHSIVLPPFEGDTEISLRWVGFEGWTVASSLGPGQEPRRVTMPLDRFRSSFLIAGEPSEVRLSTRELRGNSLGLVVLDEDWGFEDNALFDLIGRIVATEREFFDDHSDPWFLVALTPNGGRATERSLSLGGTGLTDCFALFCNTGLSLDPGGPHRGRIEHLLAHEYFHTWNGGKIRIDAPEGAAYWFSEGFTEFYTRRLLVKSGLWTDEQALRDLNESLAEHDRSPARNATNDRIIEEFWVDPVMQGIPYRRGDLAALALDEAIRRHSGGETDLDALILEMHRRAVEGEPALTIDGFFELVSRHAGDAASQKLRAIVLDGADFELPEFLQSGSLRLVERAVRIGDDGFDYEQSRERGEMVGVREGTGAAEAGLRSGDKLSSIERLRPTDGPPRLRVVLRDEREIEFDAVSAPIAVRQYERTPD